MIAWALGTPRELMIEQLTRFARGGHAGVSLAAVCNFDVDGPRPVVGGSADAAPTSMRARRGWLALLLGLVLIGGAAAAVYALPEIVRRVAVARIHAATDRPVSIERSS